ncbi:MAG: type II toxin-antitoxin system VapC family toxin [Chloroflexota bacterium]
MTISGLAARHRRVALDSNVVVYVLEAIAPWAAIARGLLDAIEAGWCTGVLAAVGLSEICAGPAKLGDLALVERYAEALRSMPGMRIEPLSAEVAVDAALIRGFRGIGMADALHLASARASGATAFVTNDRRVRGSARLEVVYLDELSIA